MLEDIFRRAESARGRIEDGAAALIKKLRSSEAAVYGGGNVGRSALAALKETGVRVQCVIDRNAAAFPGGIDGTAVINPGGVINGNIDPESYIVISMYDGAESGRIMRGLKESGFKNAVSFTDLCADKEFAAKCPNIFNTAKYDYALMADSRADIERAYSLLRDGDSREVFLDILRMNLLREFDGFKLWPERMQYFHDFELYSMNPEEAVIDCGAYTGDTLEAFCALAKDRFKSYACVEPDAGNYKKITESEAFLRNRGRVQAVQCVVGETAGTAVFEQSGTSYSRIGAGLAEVEAVTIDGMFAGYNPTLIKMDIEGAEMPALRGAANTIKKNAPLLAICQYHRIQDLWEMPLLFDGYGAGYKILMRNYKGSVEYVCYAVPEGRAANANAK